MSKPQKSRSRRESNASKLPQKSDTLKNVKSKNAKIPQCNGTSSTAPSTIMFTIKNFAQSLKDKYSDSVSSKEFDLFVPKKKLGYSALTESLCELTVPSAVILTKQTISFAGNVASVKDTLVNVTEIDLANNLIADWKEIIAILEFCPKLSLLNLTRNPLQSSMPSVASFPNMRVLVLNATCIPWKCLPGVILAFPGLTEFHLSLNEYTNVELFITTSISTSIHTLYYSNNTFTDCTTLCRIGISLPSLTHLTMVDTAIADFRGNSSIIGASFPKLMHLNVNRSQISTWEAIDRLNSFPALVELRILKIPLLLQYREKEGRGEIIARLPNITRLNCSVIDEEEREEAERAFLRKYVYDDCKSPRYCVLESKHGHLFPLPTINFKPDTTMTFKISFNGEITEKIFDVRKSVLDLKKSLKTLCELEPGQFRLYFRDVDADYPDEELKFPNKLLYSLNLHTGDTFFIEPKTLTEEQPFKKT